MLLVVHAEHRLRWVAGAVNEATGHFARDGRLAPATQQRRYRVATAILDGLSPGIRLHIGEDRRCSIGFTSAFGPMVVPGRWDRRGTVSVDLDALGHLHVQLPGPCAVTLDDGDEDGPARPTSKRSVMLRGQAARLGSPRDSGCEVVLAIRVGRVTAWTGFDTTTTTRSQLTPPASRAVATRETCLLIGVGRSCQNTDRAGRSPTENIDISVTHWSGQYVPEPEWPAIRGPDGYSDPPVTDAEGKDCNVFHGDYTGLAVDQEGGIHVVWTGLNRLATSAQVDPYTGGLHDGYAQDAMYARR